MRRYELLQAIAPLLEGQVVVCNLGYPSRELYALADRPTNFYVLGSMGLTSSIGLGLALSTDQRVIAIDGDGSVLMNLGSLATIGNRAPKNLTLLIVDNGSYGSTGDQPTFTAGRTNLAAIARGAGVPIVEETRGMATVDRLRALLAEPGPQVLIAHVEPGSVPGAIIPLSPITIRDRFVTELRPKGWSRELRSPDLVGAGTR